MSSSPKPVSGISPGNGGGGGAEHSENPLPPGAAVDAGRASGGAAARHSENPLQRARKAPAAHTNQHHDVLVIGAGPSGAACAYWLASAGWDVGVVERKHFPREKTCGDGLTPRAVRQLADMGLSHALDGHHRYRGLRAIGFGRSLELRWPAHPQFPAYGVTVTRHDLDQIVAENASKAGATLYQGTEAVAPLGGDGAAHRDSSLPGPATRPLPYTAGARVKDKESGRERDITARYVVVADGSNSRFGWALGTSRSHNYPLGMAVRGYWRSPRHDDPWIESHLDIRDAEGNVVPGYGWIFPLGDGRVNVGAGLLSTSGRWKGLNTSKIMDAFLASAPKSWELTPQNACSPVTGGKLPMGLCVAPRSGENVLVAGDAAGTINPFNGEGISYAYETGRMAALVLADALASDDPGVLRTYPALLEQAYGDYYRFGRAFVRLIENPVLMRACVGTGLRSRTLMDWILQIMANLMPPDRPSAARFICRELLPAARWRDPAGRLDR